LTAVGVELDLDVHAPKQLDLDYARVDLFAHAVREERCNTDFSPV
jgi:hypothetical protein